MADPYRLADKLGATSPVYREWLRLYDQIAVQPLTQMRNGVAASVPALSATPGDDLGTWLVNRLFGADPTRRLDSALGPVNPADVTYAIDNPQPTSKTRPDLFQPYVPPRPSPLAAIFNGPS